MSISASKIRCPTCGHTALSRVRRAVRTKLKDREVVVRNVEIEECGYCGERLYDMAALAKLREARAKAPRNDAA